MAHRENETLDKTFLALHYFIVILEIKKMWSVMRASTYRSPQKYNMLIKNVRIVVSYRSWMESVANWTRGRRLQPSTSSVRLLRKDRPVARARTTCESVVHLARSHAGMCGNRSLAVPAGQPGQTRIELVSVTPVTEYVWHKLHICFTTQTI